MEKQKYTQYFGCRNLFGSGHLENSGDKMVTLMNVKKKGVWIFRIENGWTYLNEDHIQWLCCQQGTKAVVNYGS
jgi:hypothetical protein